MLQQSIYLRLAELFKEHSKISIIDKSMNSIEMSKVNKYKLKNKKNFKFLKLKVKKRKKKLIQFFFSLKWVHLWAFICHVYKTFLASYFLFVYHGLLERRVLSNHFSLFYYVVLWLKKNILFNEFFLIIVFFFRHF